MVGVSLTAYGFSRPARRFREKGFWKICLTIARNRKMKKIKISFDTWVQLLGMVGVLGGLVFVGLEMQQSQKKDCAAAIEPPNFINILNSFNESGDTKFLPSANKIRTGSSFNAARKNASTKFCTTSGVDFENDFIQYDTGLMDN